LAVTPPEDFLAISRKYDEQQTELSRERTLQDAYLVRALYERAIAMNPYYSNHAAARSLGVNYTQHHNNTPQHSYAADGQPGMKVEDYGNSLRYFNNQAAQLGGPAVPAIYSPTGPRVARPVGSAPVSRSSNIKKSPSASGLPHTPINKSSLRNKATLSSFGRRAARNADIQVRSTSTMAELREVDFLVEYPKQSGNFYVLTCPLCARKFESAHGMYTHINQSDRDHMDLFGDEKEKGFALAVEVGGTLITDATPAAVNVQNTRAVRVS
jgi:hypothetical protein